MSLIHGARCNVLPSQLPPTLETESVARDGLRNGEQSSILARQVSSDGASPSSGSTKLLPPVLCPRCGAGVSDCATFGCWKESGKEVLLGTYEPSPEGSDSFRRKVARARMRENS